MAKHNINIQDGYLFQSLKEGQTMYLELVTGRHLLGRLKRFDRFAVVLESEGRESRTGIHCHHFRSASRPEVRRPPGAPDRRRPPSSASCWRRASPAPRPRRLRRPSGSPYHGLPFLWRSSRPTAPI